MNSDLGSLEEPVLAPFQWFQKLVQNQLSILLKRSQMGSITYFYRIFCLSPANLPSVLSYGTLTA